jgi:simple sugar transport system ATP-binding protein
MMGASSKPELRNPGLTPPSAIINKEAAKTAPLLALNGVSLRDRTQHLDALKQISLEIFPGEILGVAGVEGNGQSPLVELLRNPKAHRKGFLRRLGLVRDGLEGTDRVQTSGEILLKGQSINDCDAKMLRRLGVGVIPEDRCQEGLVLDMTAWENFILGYEGHPDCQGFGMISHPKILEAWYRACDEFDIRPRDPWLKGRQFSGGNQQKIIMARELRFGPELILCCHPTRGVDFAAAELIYTQLRAAQRRGAAILLVSSSLDEIFNLADRIVILYGGALVGNLVTSQTTPEEVGYLMTGLGHHGPT